LGDLSLDGPMKSVRGALSLALAAKSNGKRESCCRRKNQSPGHISESIQY